MLKATIMKLSILLYGKHILSSRNILCAIRLSLKSLVVTV